MSSRVRFLTIYALFAAAALVIMLHKDAEVPINRPFSEFPEQAGAWHTSGRNEFSANVLSVLKPTDYLYRHFKDPGGTTVSLYIGYHGGGKEGGEIHSPKHCLPGSGWYEVSTRRRTLDVAGGAVNLVQAVYQKSDSRELFLYWFQVRDRSVSDEYSLKLAEIVNSVRYSRRDASFIRVSLPIEPDLERAVARGEQFVRDVYPLLREYLPQ